jgi:DoxX-like protein
MTSAPHLWWPTAVLALALFADALVSIRPPGFIRKCLDGVGFPRDWWWALVVIKLFATAGLVIGLKYPGVGFTTNIAVIAYFICAAYAHYRARFLKQEFWLNCLGMLALSVAVLMFSYDMQAIASPSQPMAAQFKVSSADAASPSNPSVPHQLAA